jgi:hypothetical protein
MNRESSVVSFIYFQADENVLAFDRDGIYVDTVPLVEYKTNDAIYALTHSRVGSLHPSCRPWRKE